MKKLSLILTITLVLALVAGSVYAWGPGKGKGMGYNAQGQNDCLGQGNYPRRGFSNLTDEQQEQLNGLRQKFIDDTYELRSSQLVTRQQIRLLIQTSNPDRAKLDKLYDDLDNIRKQIRSKRLDFQLEAKKIDPQLAFAQGFKKGHGGKRRQHYRQDCPRFDNAPEPPAIAN